MCSAKLNQNIFTQKTTLLCHYEILAKNVCVRNHYGKDSKMRVLETLIMWWRSYSLLVTCFSVTFKRTRNNEKSLNFWSFWPWIDSEPLHHNAQIITESTATLNPIRRQSELASFGWPIWIYVMQFHVFFHQIKISDHISVYECNIWVW